MITDTLDLYQLTMGQTYFLDGRAEEEAIFNAYMREAPFGQQWAINCGLGSIIEYLEDFRFDDSDLDYLASLRSCDVPKFVPEFLEFLRNIRFTCDVHAVPEGLFVGPNIPLVKVRGPVIQAQLAETAILNALNISVLCATKARRIVNACGPDSTVIGMGARRCHSVRALNIDRALYIGGFHATSNVGAGKKLGVPVAGTSAHSMMMFYGTEFDAMLAHATRSQGNCAVPVDTYDTKAGVGIAVAVNQAIKQHSKRLDIRLDSGDLCELSRQARKTLDNNGLSHIRISASGSLDEQKIAKLRKNGAKIDIWGVGERAYTSSDQPVLNIVYKMAARRRVSNAEWGGTAKIVREAPGKSSLPGNLTVTRTKPSPSSSGCHIIHPEGQMSENCHLLHARGIGKCPTAITSVLDGREMEEMLRPIYDQGTLVYETPTLPHIRRLVEQETDLNSGSLVCWVDSEVVDARREIEEGMLG